MSSQKNPSEINFELLENARHPRGIKGLQMLEHMKEIHAELTEWAFQQMPSFGNTILDIGCGAGYALNRLAENYPGTMLYGCDLSSLSLECAKEYNLQLIKEKRLSLRLCGVPKLDWPDAFFDSVYSIECIYFWPDIMRCLREVRRVLKPGGCFLSMQEMVGNYMSPRHQAIASRMNMFCPSPDELQKLLEDAGFETVRTVFDVKRSWLCGTAKNP